ncbi:hypothetical protein MHBO_000531 [Bonamia ostreae]|uniref:Uncharacterized protein n=1 Tax=Bonamia ostreae TaxID=126728 RepID=A0ABV2AFZ7_9EUKA
MSLFAPYRALGIVCNNVPISGENLGNDDFLTCAVGDTFHVYNVSIDNQRPKNSNWQILANPSLPKFN